MAVGVLHAAIAAGSWQVGSVELMSDAWQVLLFEHRYGRWSLVVEREGNTDLVELAGVFEMTARMAR